MREGVRSGVERATRADLLDARAAARLWWPAVLAVACWTILILVFRHLAAAFSL